MRSRSSNGARSLRERPVNDVALTVARSEPEPFTHNTRARRPRKSVSFDLALVLPPPQLQTERSAPRRRERATNWSSVERAVVPLMVSASFNPGGTLRVVAAGNSSPDQPHG